MTSQEILIHPMPSKIAIIGAGMSGLAAAKQLTHHNPVVFEATDSIGGVWKHCSYRSTKLQSLRLDYEFSDFPWPNRDNETFPSHAEILEYLHAYATHFDLLKHVRFNSKVVEIRFVGDRELFADNLGDYGNLLPGKPVWSVAVQTIGSETIQWYSFELLVICIGMFGDVANIPEFPKGKGPEVFDGKVLHSMDYSKLDKEAATRLLKGKRAVIVGFKKSAIDLAAECAEANQGDDGQPCTMLIRSLHWIFPSYWVWGLPFPLFYATRSAQFLNERPNQSLLRTLLSPVLSPMRRAKSKFIESYLTWKLPLEKYGLKPEHPFEEEYATCQMVMFPENFFKEADKGKILFKKVSKWWFYKDGVEFEDGSKLEADIVLFATGFSGTQKLKSILPEPFKSSIVNSDGAIPLYRGTIHPLIPNMAFVGYLQFLANIQTAELRSRWLRRLVDGKFKLPSVHKMFEQIAKEIELAKTSNRFKKQNCLSTYLINHRDELCEEMGMNPWRKKNWILEAFSPYSGQDYAEEEED